MPESFQDFLKQDTRENFDKYAGLAGIVPEIVGRVQEATGGISNREFYQDHLNPLYIDKFAHMGVSHSSVRFLNKVQEDLPEKLVGFGETYDNKAFDGIEYFGRKMDDPSFQRKTAVSVSFTLSVLAFKETGQLPMFNDPFFSWYDMAFNTAGVTTGAAADYISERYGDGSFREGVKYLLKDERDRYDEEFLDLEYNLDELEEQMEALGKI